MISRRGLAASTCLIAGPRCQGARSHNSTVDEEGVALAAIQGLYQHNQDLKAQIEALQNQRTPPVTFTAFDLIGLIALVISGLAFWQVQRQLKQAGRS